MTASSSFFYILVQCSEKEHNTYYQAVISRFSHENDYTVQNEEKPTYTNINELSANSLEDLP